MMLPKVSVDNLMALPLNYAFVISAAPIFFTSFGFHIIMGSVNSYLDGSVTQFRKAILIGTAIPLVAYLVWQLATHGVLAKMNSCKCYKRIQPLTAWSMQHVKSRTPTSWAKSFVCSQRLH